MILVSKDKNLRHDCSSCDRTHEPYTDIKLGTHKQLLFSITLCEDCSGVLHSKLNELYNDRLDEKS
jgi:hypothetical protein